MGIQKRTGNPLSARSGLRLDPALVRLKGRLRTRQDPQVSVPLIAFSLTCLNKLFGLLHERMSDQ
jgi:hypothetical protein